MKIGIITFHFVNNFGGVLQAYALRRVLAANCPPGDEVSVIDYRNRFIRFTDTVRLFPITGQPGELVSGCKTMRLRIGRLRKFRSFRERCNLTKPYSASRIRRDNPGFDVYVSGSDQIWNPYLTFGVDKNYFLDFAKPTARRVSYAASMGTGRIRGFYMEKMLNCLKEYDAISVREKMVIGRIQDATGKEAVQLIDPVFLLTKEEWREVATVPEEVRGSERGYILLYIMQYDKSVYDHARALKEKLGYDLIEISRYGYRFDFVDRVCVDVGPAEFLGLFSHASYICTNSYHGLAFSLIFEKKCFLIPCQRFRLRITNLLELLEIEHPEAMTPSELAVDFDSVRERICAEKERAIRFLREETAGRPESE